jgi:hypothetical protein
MEIPTIHLTRQEMEHAALSLGAKFRTVEQWRYRDIPLHMQLKLMRHFGGAIVIDEVASQVLPPVKQQTLADLCRAKFLTPSGI